MLVKQAKFVKSSALLSECPDSKLPEHAFIGRSNVGKSSLINALTNKKSLAKTSGTPGKTKLINHFLIDETWHLVDLPGYGWAKVSKTDKATFEKIIRTYIGKRENLSCVYVLIDIRHKPQQVDMEFMRWLGENAIPFAMVFTKADKLKRKGELEKAYNLYKTDFLKEWENLPEHFITSAAHKTGLNELLQYIEQVNELHRQHYKK